MASCRPCARLPPSSTRCSRARPRAGPGASGPGQGRAAPVADGAGGAHGGAALGGWRRAARGRGRVRALSPAGLAKVERCLLPTERAVITVRRHWAVVAEPILTAL